METVSLKEYFESRLEALDEARDLQAKEYERRLTSLNHAHEEAVKVQHTYVTQDKYDDFVAGYHKWQAAVDRNLSTSDGTNMGTEKSWTKILTVVAIIISLISVGYAIFK